MNTPKVKPSQTFPPFYHDGKKVTDEQFDAHVNAAAAMGMDAQIKTLISYQLSNASLEQAVKSLKSPTVLWEAAIATALENQAIALGKKSFAYGDYIVSVSTTPQYSVLSGKKLELIQLALEYGNADLLVTDGKTKSGITAWVNKYTRETGKIPACIKSSSPRVTVRISKRKNK